MKLLIVGLGGFLGAAARYLIGGWISNYAKTSFPLGTFVINISGSLLLGFFITLATERLVIDSNIRPFIAIGFLGAYTTFSTFSFETIRLVEDGSLLLAATNVVGSVLAGLIAVYAGMLVGKNI